MVTTVVRHASPWAEWQLQPPGRDAEATVAQPNTFRSHVIA